MKRPIYFEETRQATHCSSISRKAKVYEPNTPCKNKHLKGYVKTFLFNN